ncbi:GntR family transcriptional regulator [Actinomadura sp. HBU206391]|nr:GntR family transcriptional regulator [Actinomadura sp. HBU206391]
MVGAGKAPEGTAAERVTSSLRRLVLTGALPPGAQLSQSRIAADYGVSRIPVRDALQVLSSEGLVDLGRSTAVVHGLSISELQELYELREAVEPMLTGLAVPSIGRAEVTQMTSLAEAMESPLSATDWLAANAKFHALAYSCADRPRMIELTDRLRRLTDRYIHLHVSVIGDTDHLHTEHRQILAAVRRGDAAAAAKLTRAHIATAHEFILRYLLGHDS